MNTPEQTGRLCFSINGADLVGVRVGGRWFFESSVEGIPYEFNGSESAEGAVETFARAALAADPGVAGPLAQLADAMIAFAGKGGAS